MNGSVVFARWHYCAPHLIHVSLVQPECKSQTTFRLVQLFLHSSQQSIPIIYSGLPLASSKLPVTMGHLDPHALAWFLGGSLGPLESSTQTASCSAQPFLQGSLVWQLTDHATQLAKTGYIYIHSIVMQPKTLCKENIGYSTQQIKQKSTSLILLSSISPKNVLISNITVFEPHHHTTYRHEPCNKSSPAAEMDDHLATTDKPKSRGLLCPFPMGKLGPHLTRCLDWGLPLYQVVSWSRLFSKRSKLRGKNWSSNL